MESPQWCPADEFSEFSDGTDGLDVAMTTNESKWILFTAGTKDPDQQKRLCFLQLLFWVITCSIAVLVK